VIRLTTLALCAGLLGPAFADPPPVEVAAMTDTLDVQLGYTIVYVPDVGKTIDFFEAAFGLQRGFVHPEGTYGEMATGDTKLAFAALQLAEASFGGVQPGSLEQLPHSVEIALVTADVEALFARAVGAGAIEVAAPVDKPWGQTVAYVRDPDGTLVELASPMGGAEKAPDHVLTLLAVSDLDRAVAFYRAAFGWATRIEVPVLVEFELPDGRGLALYQREGFGANTHQLPVALADGEIAGTEIYLHCADLEDVIGKLKAAGARELGPLTAKDWGDEVAYFADPDGNVLAVARPLP